MTNKGKTSYLTSLNLGNCHLKKQYNRQIISVLEHRNDGTDLVHTPNLNVLDFSDQIAKSKVVQVSQCIPISLREQST